jgi:hypothetical protein
MELVEQQKRSNELSEKLIELLRVPSTPSPPVPPVQEYLLCAGKTQSLLGMKLFVNTSQTEAKLHEGFFIDIKGVTCGMIMEVTEGQQICWKVIQILKPPTITTTSLSYSYVVDERESNLIIDAYMLQVWKLLNEWWDEGVMNVVYCCNASIDSSVPLWCLKLWLYDVRRKNKDVMTTQLQRFPHPYKSSMRWYLTILLSWLELCVVTKSSGPSLNAEQAIDEVVELACSLRDSRWIWETLIPFTIALGTPCMGQDIKNQALVVATPKWYTRILEVAALNQFEVARDTLTLVNCMTTTSRLPNAVKEMMKYVSTSVFYVPVTADTSGAKVGKWMWKRLVSWDPLVYVVRQHMLEVMIRTKHNEFMNWVQFVDRANTFVANEALMARPSQRFGGEERAKVLQKVNEYHIWSWDMEQMKPEMFSNIWMHLQHSQLVSTGTNGTSTVRSYVVCEEWCTITKNTKTDWGNKAFEVCFLGLWKYRGCSVEQWMTWILELSCLDSSIKMFVWFLTTKYMLEEGVGSVVSVAYKGLSWWCGEMGAQHERTDQLIREFFPIAHLWTQESTIATQIFAVDGEVEKQMWSFVWHQLQEQLQDSNVEWMSWTDGSVCKIRDVSYTPSEALCFFSSLRRVCKNL